MVGVEENGRAAHAQELHNDSEAVAGGGDGVGEYRDGLLLDDALVDALWKVLLQGQHQINLKAHG